MSEELNSKISYIASLPGLLVIKDLESHYLSMTNDAAKFVGWKSVDESIGKSDYDLPSAAANSADRYVEMDRLARNTLQRVTAIEIHEYADGWAGLMSTRVPYFLNNEQCIGTFCSLTDITKTNIFKTFMLLQQDTPNIFKGSCFIIDPCKDESVLTLRQNECIFYLLRGKTNKEIAKILNISYRTVEHHFEEIKNKFMCQTRSQLIEKVLSEGYFAQIPLSLILKNLNG